ncbi:MAG: hemerythrin domain-containing protein [Gallionella sp.]|jgi:hemerythrin-like domain-containing protein|nr:hemerythrin domain-containing protein [Gallionella sp.]MCK9355049.1 hemerythrin domain-containing protein [Gallionella sp.]
MIGLDSGARAPTFDHPLEMLLACHGKILHQCDTLHKLAVHLRTDGCDTQARQAAQSVLRYFNTAGQFHHQDEEENLFPALRASAGDDPEQLDTLLQRLLAEHVVMLATWGKLRPVLLQLAEGMNIRLDEKLAERFINSYTMHIAVENSELLPLAARLLSPEQLRQIGTRMAERRGASMPGSP